MNEINEIIDKEAAQRQCLLRLSRSLSSRGAADKRRQVS